MMREKSRKCGKMNFSSNLFSLHMASISHSSRGLMIILRLVSKLMLCCARVIIDAVEGACQFSNSQFWTRDLEIVSMKRGLLVIFISTTLTYTYCMLTVLFFANGRWLLFQQVGSSTVLSIMYIGFLLHFYLQNVRSSTA